MRPVVRGGTYFQPDDFHIIGTLSGTRDVGGPNGIVDHLGFRLATVETGLFLLGDCNLGEVVDFTDISVFISVLSAGDYLEQADINQDNSVSFLDIGPFISVLSTD